MGPEMRIPVLKNFFPSAWMNSSVKVRLFPHKFMFIALTNTGIFEEKPEVLEQWLGTEEGQGYVVKNKLFHLVKKKTDSFETD